MNTNPSELDGRPGIPSRGGVAADERVGRPASAAPTSGENCHPRRRNLPLNGLLDRIVHPAIFEDTIGK